MMKKVISFITALSIIGTMSFATYAYDEPMMPVAPTSSYGVMPLYDNVHYVQVHITFTPQKNQLLQ